MSEPQDVVEVDGVDCRFEQRPWPFAVERAAEIDRHWHAVTREKPKLFNGRVLLLHRGAVESDAAAGTLFRGAYLQTDFKAFLAWRDLGMPESGVRNGFGMAALLGSDGAYVLGEMGRHTANAGRVYFASGTPDPTDIVDGAVDIEGSVRRELLEETGISPDEVSFEPGFTLILDRHQVGFMKRVRSSQTAATLKTRIEAFLARDAEPELCRMHVVREVADIGPQVQSSCATFLRAKLAR